MLLPEPGSLCCRWVSIHYWATAETRKTHNRFGDRSFAVAGPRLWNSLPLSLRTISSYGQFRRYLKNHLFGIWEITAQCDAWYPALYKYSYLLTSHDSILDGCGVCYSTYVAVGPTTYLSACRAHAAVSCAKTSEPIVSRLGRCIRCWPAASARRWRVHSSLRGWRWVLLPINSDTRCVFGVFSLAWIRQFDN